MNNLETLQDLMLDYAKDPVFDSLKSKNFVGPTGPVPAKIMLIGEAPGKIENAKRVPFVGPSGLKLTEILQKVGIDPYLCYMTNVIKYWPLDSTGKTRTPTDRELSAARPYIQQEIEIVCPDYVGLVGRSALMTMFPEHTSVKKVNGELLEGCFVPLFHPANILYSPHKKAEVESGYRKLKGYING